MNEREHLGSRLGFIMLSAGCAIGVGNVWKFPWMCGQNGGSSFIIVYLLFLLILGIPVLTMEFAVGRASQASPFFMMKKLQPSKGRWGFHGYMSLAGNVCLMAFYTVVAGWIFYFFIQFLLGRNQSLDFNEMLASPTINVAYMAIIIVTAFIILSFKIQNGLEKVTKVMMIALLICMLFLAIRSCTLSGAAEGLRFYLVPDFSLLTGDAVVAAMNQAFFTLSLGIGSMAIFGSYIGKDRSLLGESVIVCCLDTFVAIMAGMIIFPACFSYGEEVTAGPALLFETMAEVFNHMGGGRWWGTMFFLFMVFASLSTVLGVCENILSMVEEMTGMSKKKSCLVSASGIFLLGLTTALGYNVIRFQPFAEGTTWLDLWDFIVSTNLLPLGSVVVTLFCCGRLGWGWSNFMEEANTGKGLRVKEWMHPVFRYFVPVVVVFIYIYGIATFSWN